MVITRIMVILIVVIIVTVDLLEVEAVGLWPSARCAPGLLLSRA